MMAPSLPSSPENMQKSISFCKKFNIETIQSVDFWTEASLFSKASIAAIVLGPGDIQQAHTVDEWVLLSQLEQSYQIYMKVINNEN
jgi:acetylornithine deacetylase